jgi:hypothetical protein
MMGIKSRFKRLFRRKPRCSIADIVDVLESLEREVRAARVSGAAAKAIAGMQDTLNADAVRNLQGAAQ